MCPPLDPPRNGEGDRREAVVEGARLGVIGPRATSTTRLRRAVPLPLQGRISSRPRLPFAQILPQRRCQPPLAFFVLGHAAALNRPATP
jgi:hypothetical protein